MATEQLEMTPITREMERKTPTPMGLLNVALQNNAAIDVIERLAALQEKAMKWDAEIQFNQAMNAAQSELGRIAPNATNKETDSRWATYGKLDKILRPIYIRHGFSLSFDTADAPSTDMVRAVCYVSHRDGHSRRYQADVPYADKGPKGGNVMTKTHGSGAAMSYAQRYLLKYIFNIAIGEDDTDGNATSISRMDPTELEDRLKQFANCHTLEELQRHFAASFDVAFKAEDMEAQKAIVRVKDERKAALKKGGSK